MGGNSSLDTDEIAKIRQEFDAAKQSFLKIPEALKGMPKMNPQGSIISELRKFVCFYVFILKSMCSLSVCDSLGIYVNKNLNLDNIQVYGFDYDYTLAHYSSNLQSLIYDLAKEYMVNEVSLCIHPLHLVAAIIVKCC